MNFHDRTKDIKDIMDEEVNVSISIKELSAILVMTGTTSIGEFKKDLRDSRFTPLEVKDYLSDNTHVLEDIFKDINEFLKFKGVAKYVK